MHVPFKLWAEQQSSQFEPKHDLPLTVHPERQMPFAAERLQHSLAEDVNAVATARHPGNGSPAEDSFFVHISTVGVLCAPAALVLPAMPPLPPELAVPAVAAVPDMRPPEPPSARPPDVDIEFVEALPPRSPAAPSFWDSFLEPLPAHAITRTNMTMASTKAVGARLGALARFRRIKNVPFEARCIDVGIGDSPQLASQSIDGRRRACNPPNVAQMILGACRWSPPGTSNLTAPLIEKAG